MQFASSCPRRQHPYSQTKQNAEPVYIATFGQEIFCELFFPDRGFESKKFPCLSNFCLNVFFVLSIPSRDGTQISNPQMRFNRPIESGLMPFFMPAKSSGFMSRYRPVYGPRLPYLVSFFAYPSYRCDPMRGYLPTRSTVVPRGRVLFCDGPKAIAPSAGRQKTRRNRFKQ